MKVIEVTSQPASEMKALFSIDAYWQPFLPAFMVDAW